MFFPLYSTINILWYIQILVPYIMENKYLGNRNFHKYKCKRQNLTYFESSPRSWSMASRGGAFDPSEVSRTSRFDCNRSLAFSWIRSFFSSSASNAEFNWSNWASRALKAKKNNFNTARFLEFKIYGWKFRQIREISFTYFYYYIVSMFDNRFSTNQLLHAFLGLRWVFLASNSLHEVRGQKKSCPCLNL